MTPSHPHEEPSPRGRWKHGGMPVIGLIGGIGSGKSHVASLLAARGAAVIDADSVGHELLGDPEIRASIIERFGTGVLALPREDGAAIGPIDRRAWARSSSPIPRPAMRWRPFCTLRCAPASFRRSIA